MLKLVRVLSGCLLLNGFVACGSGGEPVDDLIDDSVDSPDKPGSFGVGHLVFTAVDPARTDREMLVDVWYPVDDEDVRDEPRTAYSLGPLMELESGIAVDDLPVSSRQGQTLIVFSHGYGGINIQSTELMETLASHGFVVAAPEHTGNAQSSMTDEYDVAAEKRVPDVSAIIHTMITRNRDPVDRFYDLLDEENVGVVGHSFGGMTAIGMAAGWAGARPDPRVAAIAPISAVIDPLLQSDKRNSPYAGFTREQLAGIVVPVMLIGGTEDVDVPVGNNDLAFDQLVSAPSVYQVDIIGANHTHFANVCTIGNLLLERNIAIETWRALGAEDLVKPYQETCTGDAFPIEEATRLQNLYVVSFFKRYLLYETGYDGHLSAAYANTEPAVTFSVKKQAN